jgi:hypothetical protein
MIRIAISQAAFDAIAATDTLRHRELRGEDQRQGRAADLAGCPRRRQLTALRGSGESHSEVILRLAAGIARRTPVAVVGFKMRPTLRQIDEAVDPAHEVIARNVTLKAEAVEQRLLHHPSGRRRSRPALTGA